MYLNLVEFACYPKDEPKYFFLDDIKYDDWVRGEPQEGYKVFKLIWCGEVESIITKEGVNV